MAFFVITWKDFILFCQNNIKKLRVKVFEVGVIMKITAYTDKYQIISSGVILTYLQDPIYLVIDTKDDNPLTVKIVFHNELPEDKIIDPTTVIGQNEVQLDLYTADKGLHSIRPRHIGNQNEKQKIYLWFDVRFLHGLFYEFVYSCFLDKEVTK